MISEVDLFITMQDLLIKRTDKRMRITGATGRLARRAAIQQELDLLARAIDVLMTEVENHANNSGDSSLLSRLDNGSGLDTKET